MKNKKRTKRIKCPVCKGTGLQWYVHNKQRYSEPCATCGGSKRITVGNE